MGIYTEEITELLAYFSSTHLPTPLRKVAEPFEILAGMIGAPQYQDKRQTIKALEKLLEAKDCAVRAAL